MPAAAPIFVPPLSDPPRKRFTRADVDQLEEAGLFAGLRYELIEGDLIDKMGQNPPHSSTIQRINRLLSAKYGIDNVRVQMPLEVIGPDHLWSLPEPDLVVVLDQSRAEFDSRHPRGDEAELVIEVADTTLRHDRSRKRDLYARAGVREYWVLDVAGRQLFVYEQPVAGAYTVRRTLSEHDAVHELAVAEMLPAKA